MSDYIEMAIMPCLLIAVVPIYFEDSLSVKEFFNISLVISVGVLLMFLTYGLITEILGYGFVANVDIKNFDGLEFFRAPYGNLAVVASLALIYNLFRRFYLKKTRRFNMLVEKYKIQIREIRRASKRQELSNKEEK